MDVVRAPRARRSPQWPRAAAPRARKTPRGRRFVGLRAAIVTLAGSGLRIGELLGLKVSNVDFKAGTIRVERQRL
ncbi:tyrosine-type recombinase/integrase [Streptomyces sp. PSKA30]|nr:tyrosine-type recombinase/integrase [Streptomyces sp. PSKA30]